MRCTAPLAATCSYEYVSSARSSYIFTLFSLGYYAILHYCGIPTCSHCQLSQARMMFGDCLDRVLVPNKVIVAADS